MDILVNKNLIVGCIQGARLYNPQNKVIVEYVGSFDDNEKVKL